MPKNALMRWGIRRPHRLGIALSGGGARGFAHIRVLRVLIEAGWRPEIVTGTSAGGIVGGLFAAGLSPEAIEALARRIGWRMFMRLDPNGNALVGTDRWARFLREAVGDVRIEDLPVRFAAVAVDLDTGEEIWIDRGPLVEAMLATSAFPGVFPPVWWEGRRLVDGGGAESSARGCRSGAGGHLCDWGGSIVGGTWADGSPFPGGAAWPLADPMVDPPGALESDPGGRILFCGNHGAMDHGVPPGAGAARWLDPCAHRGYPGVCSGSGAGDPGAGRAGRAGCSRRVGAGHSPSALAASASTSRRMNSGGDWECGRYGL